MICGHCGSRIFDELGETHSLNLYTHTDERYQCLRCGEIRVYGHADDVDQGFRFYLPERRLVADRPTCPDCTRPKLVTKLWIDDDDPGAVQYKCPECELISVRELESVDD